MLRQLKLLLPALLIFCACNNNTDKNDNQAVKTSKDSMTKKIYVSRDEKFVIDTIVSGIKIPFALDWLPDGRALVTDRGRADSSISILDMEAHRLIPICKVPTVHSGGDAGMLDILVHPDYKRNGWIYFSYTVMKPDSTITMIVDRAKLVNNCLEQRQQVFIGKPYFKSSGHYGSRMLIRDGYLFITMGEGYVGKDSAQSLSNDLGKIIRLRDDGSIPTDNPFVGRKGALAEIWSYGHRNPQGLAFNPLTGDLWEDEHGPKGGDEINIIKPGLNYGWPVICFGIDYDGKPIGQGLKEKAGMEQALHYYVPSIAPSGMLFYTGDKFPAWKNNLFIGALALTHINRLVTNGNRVEKEERLLEPEKWRVRFLKQGADGNIYFGVDGGMIMRLRPADSY